MQSAQFQLHAEIEQRHWWFVARRKIVRQLVEAVLPPNEGHAIIDVGCGTGANLAALADGYQTIGIDTSAEAIDLARQRFPRVEFHCGFAPDDLGARFAEADLVMLNDVQFVEAARAFAERIVSQSGDDSVRLRWAFEECVSRVPADAEVAVLTAALSRERRRYAAEEKAARKYLANGESPRNESIPVTEHAAWSQVAALLLNLSEAVTRN